jgi:hypothetical protein
VAKPVRSYCFYFENQFEVVRTRQKPCLPQWNEGGIRRALTWEKWDDGMMESSLPAGRDGILTYQVSKASGGRNLLGLTTLKVENDLETG